MNDARRTAALSASNATIDRSLLLFGALVLLGSVLMSPDADVLTLFGFDVPVMCGYRRWTGQPCLGCGLTRAFTFMAHLRPQEAFAAHALGPLAFVAIVGQIPYRALRLWRATRSARGYGSTSEV